MTEPTTVVASKPISMAQQVNAAQAPQAKLPAGLESRSTDNILSPWARICLYGELDSWKTVTAAHFGSPEDVRIIFTRGEDQLRGLTGENYKYVTADNSVRFRAACLYPERIWPDWAMRPNRIVITDDLTRGSEFLIDDNETDKEGREIRDNRMVHKGAKDDMVSLMDSLRMKPLHLIMVAQARIWTNNISREETISPDLPPAMMKSLMNDTSFILFLDKAKRQMLTRQRVEIYTAKNDKGKEESFKRSIMARHKIPKALEGGDGKPGLLSEYEKIDLAAFWSKIQEAASKLKAAG